MKISDILDRNITTDEALIDRIISIEIRATIREVVIKIPGVKKLIFGSLPSIYTDLVRKEKVAEVERKRVDLDRREDKR